MGNRERAKKLLLVVATAGLTACEDDDISINPPPPPLVCDELTHDSWTGLFATARFKNDPQDPQALLFIELHINNGGDWTAPPVVTALSGMTINAYNQSSRTIVARVDDGATTASFQLRGQLADSATTCDVDRTFTLTIDEENKVEITRHDALPFLPHRRASLDPGRHASFDVMRCDGGDAGPRASGGENERASRTKAAGTTEATADVARGDAGRRGRASTRRRG
ncbi:hypothetical protein WMF11_10015 [Sorangium sp. So ce295]|uniref:hypothetical protein n=1 Tax=Sorangium sp. So ce295 TaxID=3133295 RepID=UPI003F5D74C6